MKRLALYTKYAWRSIQRGGQRSFFAILCVAVGVAAIVALQTTGFSIQDAVAGDARTNARADVVVTSRQRLFSADDLAKIETLKQKGTIVDYTTWNEDNGLTVKKPDGTNSNQFGSFFLAFAIDPAKYPYYGAPVISHPQGKTIKDVLTGPNQVVLNDKMAKSTGAKVGDKIKAEGDNTVTLEVVGILDSKTTSPGTGQAEFTGYSYISQETAKLAFKPENVQPGTVFVKTASTTAADNAARDAINAASPLFEAKTSGQLNDQLKQASSGLSDLLSYVGLISLLIGSVGVVNTMLVVVGRRSTEIATIKALGMESTQTVQVFMIESAILGAFGSVIGVVLGELLSLVLSAAAAGGFVARQLDFHLYFQPVWMGLVVGIVTAVVFGLLPAYSASKIPPAQVLRQKTNALPRISFIATALIIIVMALVMGLLAGIILNGQFLLGVELAFGTLVACTALVLLFSGILWLVGKTPLPFGLNYKMARRNLSRGRAKSATTMLVMMVGIFSVALVIILASSLKDTLKTTIESSFGYNLAFMTTSKTEADKLASLISAKQVPGLDKSVAIDQANVRLVSGGGVSAQDLIVRAQAKKGNTDDRNGFGGGVSSYDLSLLVGISQQDLPSLAKTTEGTAFANDDQMVISKEVRDNYGLKVGDKMVYQDLLSGQQFTLTISGVTEQKNFLVSLGPAATTFTRVRAIPGNITQYTMNVDRAKLDEAKTFIQTSMGREPTDLSFITNVFNQIIDQITAFPILLAMLSLIAGAVLIANNVALAVLERRTEMGVMKSLGADSSRVFQIITWETNIVAFLGAVLGFSLATLLASMLVGVFGTAENPAVLSVSPVITIGLLALAVGLSLLATFGSAWGASREKPLVVLRYE